MSTSASPHRSPNSVNEPRTALVARWRLGLAWAALWAIHLGLLFQFMPPAALISERPISQIDYSLHRYQIDRASRAFHQNGKLWAWDPGQLAGHPAGTVEDMSSKTLELFVIALESLGVPQGLAFNLYILFAQLLMLAFAPLAALLYRLSRGQSLLLGVLWVLLWHFDSFIHWCWYCGMISWALAAPLTVVALGLVYRAFEALHERRRSIALSALTAAFCGLVAMLHPLAAAVVALPAAALYLRSVRGGLSNHLFAALCALFAAFGATVWLLPALPLWHYVVKSEFFLRPSPAFILYDLFELHMSGSGTGPPVQTLFRSLCFAGAAILLWRWQRSGDRRALPLIVLVGSGVAISYFGRYLWLTSTAQPYRFITGAIFGAAIPTAVLLSQTFSPSALRRLSSRAQVLVAICGLVLVPRLVRTAAYFFPRLASYAVFEGRAPSPRHPFNVVLAGQTFKMENSTAPKRFAEVREWLLRHHQGPGRVLVQDYELGEYLAATTQLPIIGGFAYRPLHHGDANLFQYETPVRQSSAEIRAYFERYAIAYVVMRKVHWRMETDKTLLTFRKAVDTIHFRIFQTQITPSYFARGTGRIVHQGLNRIAVDDASGPELVLRFHYFEALRCRPGCTVERAPLKGDRVGFIRIRNPPKRFEIYNSYDFRPPR